MKIKRARLIYSKLQTENRIFPVLSDSNNYKRFPFAKGNRDEIMGKTFKGIIDSIISSGDSNQVFTSLSWRTYRYLQLEITTKDDPLTINDIYSTFTGYPFVMNAKLVTDNAEFQKMLEIGWRTARLCALETYMDCPYYEQLQYVGDTRIQALISLYNSGDDRLVRNAINQFEYSQQSDGQILSRYPSNAPLYIPTFSVWYIAMLHDYMMYGKDVDFIKNKLTSVRRVLEYYQKYQGSDASVKALPWWNFTDWVGQKWFMGVREVGKDGKSALIDLQLLLAYEQAADLESKIGMKEYEALYRQKAEQLKKTIQANYWDNKKMLYADESDKTLFSQHSNILAILTGMVSGKVALRLGEQLLKDNTLSPASIYFKYYLHQALVKAGLGNEYLNWLGVWRENIAMGLTTWGETSEVDQTRSDCHAWGASPNIEFFRTILGIDSDAPGFSKVKIEPHLGNLKKIEGEMPHPNGKIRVKYVEENGRIKAEINLPSKITGQFIWKGKSYSLKEGVNVVKI